MVAAAIGMLVLGALVGGHADAAAPQMYPPDVINDPSFDGPGKSTIYIVWGASDKASTTFLHDNLFKIAEAYPDATVILHQLLTEDGNDYLGPGAALLCAPDSISYAFTVNAYLSTGSNKESNDIRVMVGDTALTVNRTIKDLIDSGNIDVSACASDPVYKLRLAANMRASSRWIAARPHTDLPVVIIDGKMTDIDDPAFRSRLK